MGCSASRSTDFVAQQRHPNPCASPSVLQSPYNSFSEPNSTPARKTLSLPTPLVHHPPLRKGDSSHIVALTSTTYGSLLVVDPTCQDFENKASYMSKLQEIRDSEDPSSPDSVINTWELMEGLDEIETVSFSKANGKNLMEDEAEMVKSYEFVEYPVSKPLWEHLSEESLLANLDDNVASSYRNALMRKPLEVPKCPYYELVASTSAVKSDESSCSLGAGDKIVLYYTTLRGIRKTYEDCCAVRMILRGFRVLVDERDISMDRSYRAELQEALEGKPLSLPQVFLRGKHIGGAEDIKQLNEAGELAELLKGLSVANLGFVCEVCGDARFLPCPNCNGSRKVYTQEGVLQTRCPDCNENGLIRCSNCCS